MKIKAISSSQWQRQKQATSGIVDNGGEPPDDNEMDARISKIEEMVGDTRERLTRIETRLEYTATKAGLHELRAEAKADLHELGTAIKADMHELRAEAKADLHELGTAIKADMHELRAEAKADLHELGTAIKADMHELRAEAKADLHELGTATKTDMHGLRAEAKADLHELSTAIKADMHELAIGLHKEINAQTWKLMAFVCSFGTGLVAATYFIAAHAK